MADRVRERWTGTPVERGFEGGSGAGGIFFVITSGFSLLRHYFPEAPLELWESFSGALLAFALGFALSASKSSFFGSWKR